MKKMMITIVNTEEVFDLNCVGEGFANTLEGGVQRGNMAIEAYAMAVSQVVASIPEEERSAFMRAFVSQIESFA